MTNISIVGDLRILARFIYFLIYFLSCFKETISLYRYVFDKNFFTQYPQFTTEKTHIKNR